jgi:Protein of unknown function (DUF3995)
MNPCILQNGAAIWFILRLVFMRLLLVVPLLAILFALALLHAYWALGGRWGSAYTVPTVNGRRMFDPTPSATWAVSGLLGIAAILVAGKAGAIGTRVPYLILDIGVWGLSLVFLLRAVGNLRSFGFFKTVKSTPFAHWDSWLYSPLCLLLALLAAGVALLPSLD